MRGESGYRLLVSSRVSAAVSSSVRGVGYAVTGRLRHLAATPLVDQMAYINAQSIVEAKATQILDTKPKAHCAVIDAGNKNVYVPVLGGDIVMELKFDPATGTVSPNGPGEVATRAGAGPRHLTLHPNGKFAYLITETSLVSTNCSSFSTDRTCKFLLAASYVGAKLAIYPIRVPEAGSTA
jgi:6-phosphogluconolactonase (cycloisomerase 2 family)